MSDIIARAEAALEGVTEGPWTVESQVDHMSGETEYWLPEIEQWRGYRNNIQCGTDKALARFIAAARTLVPELIAELKSARAQLALLAAAAEADKVTGV